MTKKISDTKPVVDFIDIATKYCSIIEKRDDLTEIQLLQQVFVLLPQLCLCGMMLPDINRIPHYEPKGMPHEQWEVLFNALQHKLPNYDGYIDVFDPFDKADHEPVYSSLSDDFSDIYRDLKGGLVDWPMASACQRLLIIWEWKFGFEHPGVNMQPVRSKVFIGCYTITLKGNMNSISVSGMRI